MDFTSLSVLFQGISAVAVALIAYQNYKINKQNNIINIHNSKIERDNLRLSLFEKRYKVYQSIKETLSKYFVSGKLTWDDLSEFNQGTHDADFLFNDDVNLYIKQFRENILKTLAINRTYENNTVTPETIEDDDELHKYYKLQINDGLKNTFSKYLKFVIKNN